MHIPHEMLQGNICPVTALVSAGAIGAAAYFTRKSSQQPSAMRFATVTALIFAGQMLNFPVAGGTSGHLLGGVLAVTLLGIPGGMLSMALTVTLQCLLFADGGLDALGANLLNMSIIGCGLGGLALHLLTGKRRSGAGYYAGVFAASWFSVVAASLAVAVELAAAGTIAFATVLPAMLGIHMLIGLGEGLITTVAVAAVARRENCAASRRSVYPLFFAALIAALLISPFACGYPDGLEWVAGQLQFLKESTPAFAAPMPDYAVPALSGLWSQWLAALAGIMMLFAVSYAMSTLLHRKAVSQEIRSK